MSLLENELAALVQATRDVADARCFPSAFTWIGERYRHVRLSGTDLAEDGDVLLFQWGVLDWGDGLHATIDLTRQILRAAPHPVVIHPSGNCTAASASRRRCSTASRTASRGARIPITCRRS